MRVIAGKAKGRRLKVPKGTPTRPATELVRGAIFSILENITDNWGQVLDLFSGSGSLGIEALSRGAGSVDFVEREPKGCSTIKENLENAGLAGQAHVHCTDVYRAIELLNKEYDIVLIDPPYSDPTIGNLLVKLGSSHLVSSDTVVVVTHSSRFKLEAVYGPLNMQREYHHGDSSISIYRKEVEE